VHSHAFDRQCIGLYFKQISVTEQVWFGIYHCANIAQNNYQSHENWTTLKDNCVSTKQELKYKHISDKQYIGYFNYTTILV